MRTAALLFGIAAGGSAIACQSYNMEGVDPQTVVAVETSGNFTAAKPPALLIVQDRSGSMERCFGTGGDPGLTCKDGSVTRPGASRMHVAQRVMANLVEAHKEDVLFGLTLYGVDGPGAVPGCGIPEEVAPPGSASAAAVIDAYEGHPAIVAPQGGTPTTRALQAAYETLVDSATGKVRMPERDNYVVLVTDGLMNCNVDHDPTCVCAREEGCPAESGTVAFGEVGTLWDGLLCLDDEEAIAAVERLRSAGVRTFVIGLGEDIGGGASNVGIETLNALAVAGGVPREGASEKFYSAANEQQLEEAMNDIIGKIVVPCEYRLDGPVCDGRLLSVTLRVDGEEVQTSCGEGGTEQWHFASNEDGTLDPARIGFSSDLCARFAEAQSVQISIKGVETGCPPGGTPSCDGPPQQAQAAP